MDLTDHMLRSVEVIDPKLRTVLELRAEGYSCDEIGKRLKMSRNEASNMVRTSLAVGKMFLLVRYEKARRSGLGLINGCQCNRM